jgi:hypothetical protein
VKEWFPLHLWEWLLQARKNPNLFEVRTLQFCHSARPFLYSEEPPWHDQGIPHANFERTYRGAVLKQLNWQRENCEKQLEPGSTTGEHAEHLRFIENWSREGNMLEINEFMATRCFKSAFRLFMENPGVWSAGDTTCCAWIIRTLQFFIPSALMMN